MAKERKPIKKKVITVPKNRAELEQFVSRIREAEQEIGEIENKYSKEILELETIISWLKEKAREEAKPHEKKINELAKGVYTFAKGHRNELTDQGAKKTVELAAGDKIKWYLTPPAVGVDEEEEALKELERRGLSQFIRTKKEIDKEAILQEPEKIRNLKHLSVSQQEIFAIVLLAIGIELQKGKKKFKKVAV